jgi:primosomal protein N' (replication factor Y)
VNGPREAGVDAGRVSAGSETVPCPAAVMAQVVVALPVERVFSYAVPESLLGRIAPGQRVRVPFRGRPRTGIVVALASHPGPAPLAMLQDVIDPVPALTPSLVELGRRAAAETVSAWGEVLARALPPAARVTTPPAVLTAPPAAPPGAPPIGRVTVAHGSARDRLVEAWVARIRAAGQGILLLAPEIETARRWASRLEASLGAPPAVLTSAESPRRRWEAWWALRRGERRVALGTRVAAFAPVASLGAVIVVDEHDAGHKAPDVPRWHVRELALERARLEGADCLLVSATPSLESWVRAREGRAAIEALAGGPWPRVRRVDLRTGDGSPRLAPELVEAMRAAVAAGQPVLLLLNRLGYARALSCLECGAVRRCGACRVALAYHQRVRTLVCRLCGGSQPAASLCGRCRGRRLAPLGWGTERLEAEVRRLFPGVPVGRIDSEVGPAQAAAVREAYRGGRIAVLVGTQMAARLAVERPVAVAALVLADVTLAIPDFRAGERLFQQAWQLAETVGPGGGLWLQSFYPGHPALEAVALGVPEVFYEREWTERQALRYPPASRMARLVVDGPDAPRWRRSARPPSRAGARRSSSSGAPSCRRPWPGPSSRERRCAGSGCGGSSSTWIRSSSPDGHRAGIAPAPPAGWPRSPGRRVWGTMYNVGAKEA